MRKILLPFFFITLILHATEFHVKPYSSSSDNGNGSIESPWNGFQNIQWSKILPGDELTGDNKIFNNTLVIYKSGDASGKITFKNMTIQNCSGRGIRANNRSYLIFKYLIIKNNNHQGMGFFNNCSNILIDNCTVKDNHSTSQNGHQIIFSQGNNKDNMTDITVTNNIISYAKNDSTNKEDLLRFSFGEAAITNITIQNNYLHGGYNGIRFLPSTDFVIFNSGKVFSHTIKIINNTFEEIGHNAITLHKTRIHNGVKSIIKGNTITNSGSERVVDLNVLQIHWSYDLVITDNVVKGIKTIRPDGCALILDWDPDSNGNNSSVNRSKRITVVRNYFSDDNNDFTGTPRTKGISTFEAEDCLIYNNIIDGCYYGIKNTGEVSKNNKYFNNTVVNCKTAVLLSGSAKLGKCAKVKLHNNLFSGNETVYQKQGKVEPPDEQYNLYYDYQNAGLTFSSTSLNNMDPMLNHDYTLQEDSPAYYAGINHSQIKDKLDRWNNPINETPNIGAYAFSPATPNVFSHAYYVDAKTGNDNANGSITSPWATIQKAANVANAGDTVFIKEGPYFERVTIHNSGVKDSFIVFTNYQNDEVTVNGSDTTWWRWNGLFDITKKSYIEISGLTITNSYYAGIWADSSEHIVIKNNHTYNTYSSGIAVWNSNNITVEGNEVELACNDGEQECISIANSHNCDILKNEVHHNGPGTEGGEGIDVKDGSYNVNIYKNNVHHINNRIGIYADAWNKHTHDINIFQNEIHHCSETGLAVASENGGLIENVNIFNNLVYFNKYGGIEIGDWSDINFPGAKPVENIKIINNTCYKNGYYNNGWGFGIVVDNPDAANVTIRNNICSNNNAQIAIHKIAKDSAGKELYTADHNLIHGNNTVEDGRTIFGSDSVVALPQFADTASFNFHLTNNSPAINAGSLTDAPDNDFDNNVRPYETLVDIGAYEYVYPLGITTRKAKNRTVEIYPNPFTNKLNVIINGNTKQNYIIKLYNITGQLIRNIPSNATIGKTILIDRNNLAAGFYLLSIQTNGKIIATKKIIIQ